MGPKRTATKPPAVPRAPPARWWRGLGVAGPTGAAGRSSAARL